MSVHRGLRPADEPEQEQAPAQRQNDPSEPVFVLAFHDDSPPASVIGKVVVQD